MQETPTLYPPTFDPPEERLGLIAFLRRCAQNPLATIPAATYHQGSNAVMVSSKRRILWISDPVLSEQVLVRDAARFHKTEIERHLFERVLGDGVLTSEGTNWRWQRRLLAPLFRHGEILTYVADMVAAADEQVARWQAAGATGVRAIDVDMTNATWSVIVRTMLHGGAPHDIDAVMAAGSAYLGGTPWIVAYGILGLPNWLPHPATFRLRRAARAFRASVGSIIASRETNGSEAHDLLGRLLAARDPETGKPLPRDLLVDNLATLLEAGHETTAKALTWALYLLARAPHWQDRVRSEVISAAGEAPLTAAHVARLDVTERVIKEAMRLYPPAPLLSRTPIEPIEIGGYQLNPGDPVFMPIFAIHRHRALWKDPDRFDPDRFLPDREAQLERTQYMPFGAGPRICLGATFAMVEAKTLLASFVRAARFIWDGKHLPEPVSRVTLRPKGGMPLIVELLGTATRS